MHRKSTENNQNVNKNISQCNYCNMNGHSVNNCRRQIYNEGKRDGSNSKSSTSTGNDQAFPRVVTPMDNVVAQRQNLNKNYEYQQKLIPLVPCRMSINLHKLCLDRMI